MPVGRSGAHPLGKLLQQVLRAVVEDGMHRVQPQAVEVELLDPVEGVVDHEFAHRAAVWPVEIDCRAPWRLVTIGEGLRRDRVDISAFRSEVVVDDVEQHHQPAGVGGFDQRLQVLGPAIGGIRSVGQHAVVAPVAAAGKITDRHDLDRGDAERNQMVELADRGAKRALRRKGADVQFVDDRLLPGAAAPAGVAPGIGRRIDHLARPVHILRLITRGRVRDAQAIRQHEAISRTGAGAIGDELVPALADRSHGHRSRRPARSEPRRCGGAQRRKRTLPSACSSAPKGMWCVRVARGRLLVEQRQDAAQRDCDPVRPIGEFVRNFVERLFEHKEPHDPIGIRAVLRAEAAAARSLEIGIEKGLRRLCLPGREPPFNGVPFRPRKILRQCYGSPPRRWRRRGNGACRRHPAAQHAWRGAPPRDAAARPRSRL